MDVLLVDDDPSVGAFLRQMMKRAGHLLDWRTEGRAAIDRASSVRYNAILLDLMLPDMDGVEVCAELRGISRDLPILMLSGRDRVADRLEGFSAGADDFMTKPFNFDELLARLSAIQRPERPHFDGRAVPDAGRMVFGALDGSAPAYRPTAARDR